MYWSTSAYFHISHELVSLVNLSKVKPVEKRNSDKMLGPVRRKFFSKGRCRGFSKIFFVRAAESGESWFSPLKSRKTTYFCWNFQNPEDTKFPAFPSDAHGLGVTYSLVRKIVTLFELWSVVKTQNFMNTMCIRFTNCCDVYKWLVHQS